MERVCHSIRHALLCILRYTIDRIHTWSRKYTGQGVWQLRETLSGDLSDITGNRRNRVRVKLAVWPIHYSNLLRSGEHGNFYAQKTAQCQLFYHQKPTHSTYKPLTNSESSIGTIAESQDVDFLEQVRDDLNSLSINILWYYPWWSVRGGSGSFRFSKLIEETDRLSGLRETGPRFWRVWLERPSVILWECRWLCWVTSHKLLPYLSPFLFVSIRCILQIHWNLPKSYLRKKQTRCVH